jgi:hypothetical protein
VTTEQSRALKVLADAGQRGSAAVSLMTTHGLSPDLLASLVHDGLAMMSTEAVTSGESTLDVVMVSITDAGCLALNQ